MQKEKKRNHTFQHKVKHGGRGSNESLKIIHAKDEEVKQQKYTQKTRSRKRSHKE